MFVATAAMAQDKVAYVNMATVFEGYYKTFNANIIFEQKKKEYEDKMGILCSSLEEALRELKKVEADAKNELLAEAAREEAVRKYRVRAENCGAKRDEYERSKQQGYQELRHAQRESEVTLANELSEMLRKYAADNGYTHVYDVSGQSLNGLPVLLVYPKQQEITVDFVKIVNTGHDKELADAKAKLEALRGVKPDTGAKAPEGK